MVLKNIFHALNYPFKEVFFYIFWIFNQIVLGGLYNPRTKGKENFPKKGVFIVVSNHEDNTDPLFLSLLTHRRLHFLAHDGLFRPPTRSRFFVKYFDQICTPRGRSSWVVNNSVRYLKKGKLVAIFPEGTIDDGKKIIREHTGVARIALKSGCPVLPIAINNSFGIMPKDKRFFRKLQKVKINIGKLMYFSNYQGQDENRNITKKVTHEIMEEIRRLYRIA